MVIDWETEGDPERSSFFFNVILRSTYVISNTDESISSCSGAFPGFAPLAHASDLGCWQGVHSET